MTSYSYAKLIVPDKNTELPEVLLQLELRDSNGSFISYTEAEQIIGISSLELNRFLDNQNQTRKEFFIKDDKKYEIHQWEQRSDKIKEKTAYAASVLVDIYQNEYVQLLQIRHDSLQTQPGDTLRAFWTIVRPAS